MSARTGMHEPFQILRQEGTEIEEGAVNQHHLQAFFSFLGVAPGLLPAHAPSSYRLCATWEGLAIREIQ